MKVIVTDYIEENLDWEIGHLKQHDIEMSVYQLKQKSRDEVLSHIGDAEIVVVNMVKMPEDILSQLMNCRLIIRHGAGYDNIDIAAATRQNIQVAYVPDYCQEEVAEQAMTLMLVTFRKFIKQQKSLNISVKKGEWDFSPVIPLSRFAGKKVGLVGCGRIGSKVLKMLRGFDVNVLVCDPYLAEQRQKELQINCVPLETVLEEADLVSIHCSLNSETKYLINDTNIKLMKNTAILVNTARGSIIDSMALADACRQNQIAGAAIDVYDNEPPKPDFELIGLDNVILTPHLSWYSVDAEWSIRKKIVEDIFRFKEGIAPRFPINKV